MSRDLNGLITWLRDWFDDIYLTEHQDITGKANISDLGDAAFSNDYDDLTNKPNIPTDVSDLTDNNDTPFTPKRHTHIIPDVANLQTILNGKINISDLGNLAYEDDVDLSTHDVSELTDTQNTVFTPKSHNHSISDVSNLQTSLNTKQETLVSGTNIKTINNETLLGSGNISTSQQNVFYGTCSTSSDTQTKVVSVDNWSFTPGNILFVKFTNANTHDGTPYLQIGEESKPIRYVHAGSNSQYHWKSGEVVAFVYDSDYMLMVNEGIATTTYYGVTKLSSDIDSTSQTLAATPKAVKTAYDLARSKANSIHTHIVSDITNFPSIPTKTSDLTNDGEDGTNFFVSDDDSRLSDARTPTSHIHSISDVTNLQTSLNNKANTSHTHIKENIDFQTTTSPFNIHLYANNYMVNRNDFEIPANAQMTLNFSDLLNNNQDYVSFKIIGTGGTLSSVEIWDSHGDILYTLNSSYTITIKKITGGYEVLVYDSGDIPTSYNENVAPFIYIENYSNNIITGSFSNKTYYRKATWLDMIYPIGSVYISTQNINPSLYFGGEWEQIEDRFLLSSGQNYNVQEEGGEATHTLTENEIPSHNHTQSSHNHAPLSGGKYKFAVTTGNISAGTKARKLPDTQTNGYYFMVNDANVTIAEDTTTNSKQPAIQNTGGGQAHNNMPPYFVVSVWERIA